MTTNTKINRIDQKVSDQNLSDGLKKHQSTLASFAIAGTSSTVADVLAVLDARTATENAVEAARAVWQTKVQASRDERAKTRALVSGVRQQLQLTFAGAIDTLADFGLKPRKQPAPRTPEQKALATAKAKATRAARHTMGSVQKKGVKGTVTTIVSPTVPLSPLAGQAAAPAPVAQGSVAGAPATGTGGAGAPHAQ
jgi:hypothetical protein